MTKIERVIKETVSVRTFFFKDRLCAEGKPGQFVMIWIPGVDEIPMSISSSSPDGQLSITVAKVGDATAALHGNRRGSLIGVRGPFGSSFEITEGKTLLIGGGTGIAPLSFLVKKLIDLKVEPTFLLGARTAADLILLSKINSLTKKAGGRVLASTEDGSFGYKGVVTELAVQVLENSQFDMIYACGKEQMLAKAFALAEKHKTAFQASLERLIKCAMGLCGSCTVNRYRVCVDGPVFNSEQLREISDHFGRFRKGPDGRRVAF